MSSPAASATNRAIETASAPGLYTAIERANKTLAKEEKPTLPEGITFHLCAALTPPSAPSSASTRRSSPPRMGHRDPRMPLRVYTDVTGMAPKTSMGALLGHADWALLGN